MTGQTNPNELLATISKSPKFNTVNPKFVDRIVHRVIFVLTNID